MVALHMSALPGIPGMEVPAVHEEPRAAAAKRQPGLPWKQQRLLRHHPRQAHRGEGVKRVPIDAEILWRYPVRLLSGCVCEFVFHSSVFWYFRFLCFFLPFSSPFLQRTFLLFPFPLAVFNSSFPAAAALSSSLRHSSPARGRKYWVGKIT